MAFEHYNSIPRQWLDTCQAAAGPGQAAPGLARRPGFYSEEFRGAEDFGERHAPQRVATLSFELYSFFSFFDIFFAFCNFVASSMLPTFPFCVLRFLVVWFFQRFLRHHAAQGRFASILSFLGGSQLLYVFAFVSDLQNPLRIRTPGGIPFWRAVYLPWTHSNAVSQVCIGFSQKIYRKG